MRFPSKLERMLDAGAIIEWRPVKDFENLYAVSNEGEIKSLARINSKGQLVKERILKGQLTPSGYPVVCLCKDGARKWCSVHSLVAQTFIGERPEGREINHRDKDKTHNHVANIEYVTSRGNKEWSRTKPIESFDRKTGERINWYVSSQEAARREGCSQGDISNCVTGRCKSYKGVGWRYALKRQYDE